MKTFALLAALPALALAFSQEDYDNGSVHIKIMNTKEATWALMRKHDGMNSRKWPSWDKWDHGHGRRGYVKCIDGLAIVEPGNPNQTYRCSNTDFYDFKSHADLGSYAGEGSNTWGWVSQDGREFVAIGQADGTAFAEINKHGKLVYLGRLSQQSVVSIWREMKGYYDYMLIGSEAVGHGVQIFDMKKLLDLDPRAPKNFSTSTDLAGLFTDLPIGRSHNVVVNQELGYAVAVGAQPRNDSCAAGLIYINLEDISAPFSPGCAGQDGYVHDAQCVVYRGPDERYQGRDICYGYNEDTLTIYDATEKNGKNTSSIISRTGYYGASYTHQGWTTDPEWQEFLIMNDELDEEERVGNAADGVPVTYIWDIRDLENPKQTGYYKHKVTGIDHNLYVNDGLATLSNYGAGIHILDVSGLPQDPTGGNVEEIAFFDIHPEDDDLPGGGVVDFVGTWGHYCLPSGYCFVNTIERGGFVVKINKFAKKGGKQ